MELLFILLILLSPMIAVYGAVFINYLVLALCGPKLKFTWTADLIDDPFPKLVKPDGTVVHQQLSGDGWSLFEFSVRSRINASLRYQGVLKADVSFDYKGNVVRYVFNANRLS